MRNIFQWINWVKLSPPKKRFLTSIPNVSYNKFLTNNSERDVKNGTTPKSFKFCGTAFQNPYKDTFIPKLICTIIILKAIWVKSSFKTSPQEKHTSITKEKVFKIPQKYKFNVYCILILLRFRCQPHF